MSEEDIRHETGYKDDYKVVVDKETPWSPTNKELFQLIDKIFESERYEFDDGYDCRWLWFYISLIMMGEEQKAYEAYGLRGYNALTHFEASVKEHADDLIEELEKLKEEVS